MWTTGTIISIIAELYIFVCRFVEILGSYEIVIWMRFNYMLSRLWGDFGLAIICLQYAGNYIRSILWDW